MGALVGTERFGLVQVTVAEYPPGGILDRATGAIVSFATTAEAAAALDSVRANPSTHGHPEIVVPSNGYVEL